MADDSFRRWTVVLLVIGLATEGASSPTDASDSSASDAIAGSAMTGASDGQRTREVAPAKTRMRSCER
jgi:hypothetical protein